MSGIAGQAVDLMGEFVRLPGRALLAGDELFKSVGYRMELNARAFRQAASEGLEGDDMARRIDEIIRNPPEDVRLASIDAGRYQTFTKPLGEGGRPSRAWSTRCRYCASSRRSSARRSTS